MPQYPPVACYCLEDVPPYSVVWMKVVLNPDATCDPIMLCTRPGLQSAKGEDREYQSLFEGALNKLDQALYRPYGTLNWGWSEQYLYFTSHVSEYFLQPTLLTNGPIAVPARTLFYCTQLMMGVHWLRYNEPPDEWGGSQYQWWYPRDDSWHISTRPEIGAFGALETHQVDGILFRRMGYWDEARECVPVVMASAVAERSGPYL